MVEVGYVGTHGVNLERIDDVNRFNGDLLDGREDRINPNFGVLLFVTNGVTSSYHAFTSEIRRELSGGLSLQANYRWSKWLDTSSDTSTGQFADNAEPGKGAMNIDCLRCEKAPSLFDIPHRATASVLWSPTVFADRRDVVGRIAQGWQLAAIFTAQSGRPFSVWNGAAFSGRRRLQRGWRRRRGRRRLLRSAECACGGLPSNFSTQDFLNGLFDASLFPKPAPGTNGTLGRNTFRGPRYMTLDLALSRSFGLGGAAIAAVPGGCLQRLEQR